MPDLKHLYRRIEGTLEGLPASLSRPALAERLAPRILEGFGDLFGFRLAQLYLRHDDHYTLLRSWGEPAPAIPDVVAREQASIPVSPDTEHPACILRTPLGLTWLALAGADSQLVFAFALGTGPEAPPEAADEALLPQLRSACTWIEIAFEPQMRRWRLEGTLHQAREIQMSLLPAPSVRFGDYESYAISVPAQDVGGDVYDFLPLDHETLAVTVADASGHGLPAALQARDVITGLRMGVERDLKITRTVEKLNRVIHRSGLTTRFVSLVTGELELNGNFAYVNAGHPAPLLLDDRGVHELSVGGTVLGPIPEATYKMGFAHLDRGCSLVLYSDGVFEHGTTQGDPFGFERLRTWLRETRELAAEAAVQDLVARLRAHGAGREFEDDVTIVLLRRPR
jgi:sigma-B regulation protein RsbU (phosphoserine phosphatase)